jgi:hypothetical protein
MLSSALINHFNTRAAEDDALAWDEIFEKQVCGLVRDGAVAAGQTSRAAIMRQVEMK